MGKRRIKTPGGKPQFSKYFLKTHPNIGHSGHDEEPEAEAIETVHTPTPPPPRTYVAQNPKELLRAGHFLTNAFQKSGGLPWLGHLAAFPSMPAQHPVECAVAADKEGNQWKLTRFFRSSANESWQEQIFYAPRETTAAQIVRALSGWSRAASMRSSGAEVPELRPDAYLVTENTQVPRNER